MLFNVVFGLRQVAAGLAERCTIQVSYAIGVAQPTSISLNTFGTGKISDDKIIDLVRAHFDLRPYAPPKMCDVVFLVESTAGWERFVGVSEFTKLCVCRRLDIIDSSLRQ